MTSTARGGSRILGSLQSADGKGVVRMEERFDTDIDDLWSALTDPNRLARWIGEVEGDLRPGGAFRAHFTSGWEGTGRVEACEPPRRLLVVTKDAGLPYEEVIEATLAADGDQTILILASSRFVFGPGVIYSPAEGFGFSLPKGKSWLEESPPAKDAAAYAVLGAVSGGPETPIDTLSLLSIGSKVSRLGPLTIRGTETVGYAFVVSSSAISQLVHGSTKRNRGPLAPSRLPTSRSGLTPRVGCGASSFRAWSPPG